MNLFQLVFKQMRQRALGTWLTLLSVLLGVALACSILLVYREGNAMFGQKDFGYDVLLGPPKGSPLQLTLNTVYHVDVSPGVIPYAVFEDLARKGPPPPGRPDYRRYVKQAVPFMVGDSYKGRRIVGTSPRMFGFDDSLQPAAEKFRYRTDKSYEFAQGRAFHPRKFEAVIGSDIAEKLGLHLYNDKLSEEENEANGGAFRATHGMPGPNETPDIHKPKWHVVGILEPTHTANDRVLFVPYLSLYAIAEHEGGMIDQALMRANIDPNTVRPENLDKVLSTLGIDPQKVPESVKKKFKIAHESTAPATNTAKEEDEDAYHLDANGEIVPDLPKDEWSLSAVMVQSRGPLQADQLLYNFKVIDDRAAAVNPASVMREFFATFLASSTMILLLISLLVTIVAGVGILVSIYNSVAARMKEIAILRALGATRTKILTLICAEAGLIGLIGGLAGLVAGHLLGAVGSVFMNRLVGQQINWVRVGRYEWYYLAGVVVIAVLAGLVPAMKAYRVPVATNLVAS
jgi:putative ABC transport system permease protein